MRAAVYHRGTEGTEIAQRLACYSILCASVVRLTGPFNQALAE